MKPGDWRAELAWRVISSPAAKAYAANLLESSGLLRSAPTGTGAKSKTPMTSEEREALQAAREVLNQFAAFLDARAVEVENTLPGEVGLMRTEIVHHWLQRMCEKLLDKDEWLRQDLTRLSAVLFWLAVAMAPPIGSTNEGTEK